MKLTTILKGTFLAGAVSGAIGITMVRGAGDIVQKSAKGVVRKVKSLMKDDDK